MSKMNQSQGRVSLPWMFLVLFIVLAVAMGVGSLARCVRDLDQQQRLITEDIRQLRGLLNKQYGSGSQPRLIKLAEASQMLEAILALGNAQKVTFLSLVRQEKNKSTYQKIPTLPVEMEILSGYQQLGVFLDGLYGLRDGIVLVENFQIVPNVDNPEYIKAKIRIHIGLTKSAHGKK